MLSTGIITDTPSRRIERRTKGTISNPYSILYSNRFSLLKCFSQTVNAFLLHFLPSKFKWVYLSLILPKVQSVAREIYYHVSRRILFNSISIYYIGLPIASSIFFQNLSMGLFSGGKEWHVIYSKKWSLSHAKNFICRMATHIVLEKDRHLFSLLT